MVVTKHVQDPFRPQLQRIPYTTIGVHYPDIAQLYEKLGIAPNAKGIKYTLPAIEFEGTAIKESWEIAKFLEHKFPEPKLLGEECEHWNEVIRTKLFRSVWPLVGPNVPGFLDEKDRQFFLSTRAIPERKEDFDGILEAMAPIVKGIKEGGMCMGIKFITPTSY
jgi:glutathione S-transferase